MYHCSILISIFFSFWFQMNVGVRKLADNLQTVKTVLGMKIQSEQKLVGIFVSGFFKHNFLSVKCKYFRTH